KLQIGKPRPEQHHDCRKKMTTSQAKLSSQQLGHVHGNNDVPATTPRNVGPECANEISNATLSRDSQCCRQAKQLYRSLSVTFSMKNCLKLGECF
ncbi:hypothetical protein BaRGS_00015035, partial [Batillaria attramentaria]